MDEEKGESMFIAIDYGNSRVGIAKTDFLNIIASPVEVINLKKAGFLEVLARLQELSQAHAVEGFVIGDPGDEPTVSQLRSKIIKFADRLKQEFDIPIYFHDERYSSKIALKVLGKRYKKQGDKIDAVAAAVFLQNFLEERE